MRTRCWAAIRSSTSSLQLVTKFSPPGNTAAVYTLATGWINDLYQGLGPTDGTGIYGYADQFIVLGDASAVVLGPAPIVDLTRYLGSWYEVGSVKQFFSIGLVNTKAVYSPNPDGSIKVENSGNYFFDNGPESTIVGAALPVDETNNKLNVTFFGPASAKPPGNYWIVDLDPRLPVGHRQRSERPHGVPAQPDAHRVRRLLQRASGPGVRQGRQGPHHHDPAARRRVGHRLGLRGGGGVSEGPRWILRVLYVFVISRRARLTPVSGFASGEIGNCDDGRSGSIHDVRDVDDRAQQQALNPAKTPR